MRNHAMRGRNQMGHFGPHQCSAWLSEAELAPTLNKIRGVGHATGLHRRAGRLIRRLREDYLVFGSPQILQPEIDEVTSALRSGWIGTGPRTAA